MRRARRFLAFLREFVLGDDPLMFVLVCAGIAATAAVQALDVPAWWLLPAGALLALVVSVLRAARAT